MSYSMSVSLDGFITGPDGGIEWTAPGPEEFRFHMAELDRVGVHVLGRRLYEAMVYWETADRDPALSSDERAFALLWQALPKVAVSTTLPSVIGNTRLVASDPVAEVQRLRTAPDPGEIAVGGAGLAAALSGADLIDEYHVFIRPVIVGGGTPLLGPRDTRAPLELVQTRTFASNTIYAHYRRVRPDPGGEA